MENLSDILNKLTATKRAQDSAHPNGGVSHDAPPPPQAPYSGDDGAPCAICRGRGWYTPDVVAGHPDFGQTVICDCQRQRFSDERLDRLLRYSNLGQLSRFTFASLNPDGIAADARDPDGAAPAAPPDDRRAFADACRAAADYADNPNGWLALVGPNGSGKTHLAAAIANQCIESGLVVFFMHVPDLLDHLRAAYAPDSAFTYTDLYAQVVDAPLLVLDGLGAHSSTPWAEEKLQQILNHRFNAELPTVITAASELSELDPYIRSRIQSAAGSRVVRTRSPAPAAGHRLGNAAPDMLRRMTFASFDPRGNNPSAEQRRSIEEALRTSRNFAANPWGWLTLFGETGTGKTHLAVAIANERIQAGKPVFFAFVPELLDYFRYAFSPDSPVAFDTILDEVKSAPLLILDDLGQEHSSPWAREKLYQIIVHRHNSRIPTVITSMQDFAEQTGPIASRMRDPFVGQLVRIDAPDYRIVAP